MRVVLGCCPYAGKALSLLRTLFAAHRNQEAYNLISAGGAGRQFGHKAQVRVSLELVTLAGSLGIALSQ